MTIDVTGDYVLPAGQSLDVTNGFPALELTADSPDANPTITIDGTVDITAASGDVDGVFNDGSISSFNGSFFEVAAGGSYTVQDTDAGATVRGFNSVSWSARVINDGSYTVEGTQVAIGATVYSVDGQTSFPADFVNGGTYQVTADQNATGVDLVYAANFLNSGTFSVIGATTYGVQEGASTPATITNSGDMTITSTSLTPSIGIYIVGTEDNGWITTINNSGTLTADVAISEPNQGDVNPAPDLNIVNSGTINGQIQLGSQLSIYYSSNQPPTEIHNSGLINGAIHFGGDNVLYDGASGTQTGGIYLGAGTDTVILGNDGETVYGSSGNATITGGAGSDTIIGGSGTTTVSYASATSGVTVNLSLTTAQNTGGGGTDTLQNVQGLVGSNYDDILIAGSGSEVLDGGAGEDTAVFSGPHTAYHINPTTSGSVSDATDSYQLRSIEVLQFADEQRVLDAADHTLTARAGGDILVGGGGDDTLIAGTGTDTIEGGGGVNTAVFGGASGDYALGQNGTSETVSGDGSTATLTGIQIMEFADRQMVLGSAGQTLTARAGGDTLVGGSGDDSLIGGAGNDILVGGGGNDTLEGGGGVNIAVFSGAYADYTVTHSGAATTFSGDGSTATLTNIEILQFSDQQRVLGSAGETLTARSGGDTLVGGAGNDVLVSGAGDDVLNGGPGNDTASYIDAASGVTVSLLVSGAQDTGGDGTDTLTGIENLTGSNYDDVLTAANRGSVLQGMGGDDLLIARDGNDTLDGGAGTDTASYALAGAGVTVSLAVSGPQDTVGAGTDTLVSIEALIGSRFADTLTAGPSGSSLHGGAGNDTLISGPGNDTLDGGSGIDTAVFSAAFSAYTISKSGTVTTVSGPDGTDQLSNIEILQFTDRQVVISTAGQTLTARAGGDILVGGAGADHLVGGTGNDTLIGGLGQDTLTGGGGQDTFVFRTLGESKAAAPDLITDWTPGDRIDISAIDAARVHPFHFGATAQHVGDIVVSYDGSGHTVIDLFSNGDATPDAVIWLSGNHALTASDFVF